MYCLTMSDQLTNDVWMTARMETWTDLYRGFHSKVTLQLVWYVSYLLFYNTSVLYKVQTMSHSKFKETNNLKFHLPRSVFIIKSQYMFSIKENVNRSK